jgi:hypothetical protein
MPLLQLQGLLVQQKPQLQARPEGLLGRRWNLVPLHLKLH